MEDKKYSFEFTIEGINIDPLDYIISRIWDSGIVGDGNYIFFDDLKEVLGQILCSDNKEEK